MSHHVLLATPRMRLATQDDTTAICAMPTAGRWRHVSESSAALRLAALALSQEGRAQEQDLRVLIFEIGREIVAATVMRRGAEPELVQLVTLMLHKEMRGCRLRAQPRPPLCAVTLRASMRYAATVNGYKRMATQIANKDAKGIRLAERCGFGRVGHADRDHGVWAAGLS
jgi:hypothetical protein